MGGTQSKQEDRRFHTPDSRPWTGGRNGAGKEPQVQGWVASPPSGVWFALSQACTWEGEPWPPGFLVGLTCEDCEEPGTQGGAASGSWRARQPVKGQLSSGA